MESPNIRGKLVAEEDEEVDELVEEIPWLVTLIEMILAPSIPEELKMVNIELWAWFASLDPWAFTYVVIITEPIASDLNLKDFLHKGSPTLKLLGKILQNELANLFTFRITLASLMLSESEAWKILEFELPGPRTSWTRTN